MAITEITDLAGAKGVDGKHKDFQVMEPWLELMDDLRQGTSRVREKHDKYLPRFSEEKTDNYKRRWGNATLYPACEETIGMLTGKAFDKPPTLDEEDVPAQITTGTDTEPGLVEDIDLKGNHWQVFAQNFFKRSLRSGLCHILVDSTPLPAQAATQAEKAQAGHRPYWVMYDANQVFNWQSEVQAGHPALTQVRILETIDEPSGEFESEEVEQIRVLEIGKFRIFRKAESGDGTQGAWEERPDLGGPMTGYDGKPLAYIPLVTLYSDEDNGFMTAIPPLLDLAYQNVRHFQKQSDYDNCMTVACFPIFCATGFNSEDGKITLGPFTVCTSTNDNAKFFYAEHSGAALGAARQDLQDIKDDMAMHGLKMLMPRTGQTPTATAAAITEAKTTSQLQTAVLRLKDALELALDYTARWLGLGEDMGGSVKVDLQSLALTLQDVEQVLKAAGAPQKPVIDAETAIEELKRRGFLDESVDAKEVLAKMQNASLQASPIGGIAGTFLRPPASPAPAGPTELGGKIIQ